MADARLIDILRVLRAHEVDFIVVGGMAAVIGGAPIVTQDVDVLRANTPGASRAHRGSSGGACPARPPARTGSQWRP
jgi:hypothetical protein